MTNLAAAIEAHTENPWPEPVSLDMEPPEPLPVDSWPEILADYANAASQETETPRELPAMLALSTIAAAAQQVADVEIKPGYREPINLYAAITLPPANRKSAEFKRANKPLTEWEREQKETVDKERRQAESKLQTHKKRVDELRKQAAKAKDDGEADTLAEQIAEMEANEPEIPSPPKVFTGDVTSEELATNAGENSGAMAVMSSEGGIFETMAGRYSQGTPNLDIYLQGHAGDAVRINRRNSSVSIDEPRITVGLTIQPDVLDAMSTKPGFKGRGLLGRFLYALPPSNLGSRTGEGKRVDAFILTNYSNRVKGLLDAGKARNGERSGLIQLTEPARQRWQEHARSIEAELAPGGKFEFCTDWGGKLAGATARIAALFHLTRHGEHGVSAKVAIDDMEAAIATANALASHALAVYGLMGADEDLEGAKVLLSWIRRHGLTEFTKREAHHNHQSRFTKAEALNEPLNVLTERGYIAEKPKEEGKGRPRAAYLVNPAAHR